MKKLAFLSMFVTINAYVAPSSALEFENNGITGNFDTTISWGVARRIQSRDPALIAISNPVGGTGYSANTDDGNLNYDKGLISNALKVTHDLDLEYKNFGAFFRGTYFYDFHNNDKSGLTEQAKDKIGKDADLLDAYVRGSFEVGGRALDVRAGNQVVSWGESTFIQNSINVLNPIDVAKLRIPGAELREALLPVPMLWVSQELTDNLSMEAVYLARFENTEIDPRGTYFSTNDFASDGGQYVTTGFGFVPDTICTVPPPAPGSPTFATFAARCVPRANDNVAKDSGQYGLALRWLTPEFNNTEFGFYFMNYHSRLPLISGIAVSTIGAAATGGYLVEYPEDIKLFGISFNTEFVQSGVALQGELSYRQDVPLQIDDVEILFAALRLDQAGIPAPIPWQLSGYNAGDVVTGYQLLDVLQYQMTGTKVFGAGNPFGANQVVLLGEVGVTHVNDLPDKSQLRFEGPGTGRPGDPLAGAVLVPDGTYQQSGFADATSWGYRIVTRLDYNSALGAATLSPRIAFAHDVNGTSPGPGGNFIEGRKAITLGLGMNYLNTWTADLSYTNFFGGDTFNQIRDRDFVALNIKYSF
jgi:hypothetical protein